jgi:hypothetical protein
MLAQFVPFAKKDGGCLEVLKKWCHGTDNLTEPSEVKLPGARQRYFDGAKRRKFAFGFL